MLEVTFSSQTTYIIMKKINEIIIDRHASILGPKKVDILRMRYGLPPYLKVQTLEVVGHKYGMTVERVLHVEERAKQIITNAIIGD